MREIRRRMHTLYSRFFILSNLLSKKIGGRHPTTDIFPIFNYAVYVIESQY